MARLAVRSCAWLHSQQNQRFLRSTPVVEEEAAAEVEAVGVVAAMGEGAAPAEVVRAEAVGRVVAGDLDREVAEARVVPVVAVLQAGMGVVEGCR